jgi:hypothetical protein
MVGGHFFNFGKRGGIFCPRCKNEGFSRISAPVVLQLPHLWVVAPLLAPGSFFAGAGECCGFKSRVFSRSGTERHIVDFTDSCTVMRTAGAKKPYDLCPSFSRVKFIGG